MSAPFCDSCHIDFATIPTARRWRFTDAAAPLHPVDHKPVAPEDRPHFCEACALRIGRGVLEEAPTTV